MFKNLKQVSVFNLKSAFVFVSVVSFLTLINCNVTTTSSTPAATTSTSTPCTSNPTHNAALTVSTATSVSHNAGQDCMSCHKTGGSTTTVWSVAGTLYTSPTGGVGAAGGTLTNVFSNGNTLTVDQCGNFYQSNTAFTLPAFASYTTLTSTNSGNTMGGNKFNNNASDGSCNQAGCHDGTATTPALPGGNGVRVY